MSKERAHLADLMRNLQTMQNELERAGNESRRRLDEQLVRLESQAFVDASLSSSADETQGRPQRPAQPRDGLVASTGPSQGARWTNVPGADRQTRALLVTLCAGVLILSDCRARCHSRIAHCGQDVAGASRAPSGRSRAASHFTRGEVGRVRGSLHRGGRHA